MFTACKKILPPAFCLTALLSLNAQAFQSGPIFPVTPPASSSQVTADNPGQQNCLPPEKFSALVPYEVNSIMFRTADNDEKASEIKISMRYFFSSSDDKNMVDTKGSNLFFSYTTQSDFYWVGHDTRNSGPVISRYQNPALHLRYEFRDHESDPVFGDAGDWLDMGIEHISNGQALDATAANAPAIISASNANNHAYMDTISRVGTTMGLTLEGRIQLHWLTESDLTLKWFALRGAQDANVFWGDYANQGVDFNSFQRVRIQSRTAFPGLFGNKWQFNAELNIGSLWLPGSSWNFLLDIPFKLDKYNYTMPLAISMHRGPMYNLSDYTQSQNTFAVGLTFSY